MSKGDALAFIREEVSLIELLPEYFVHLKACTKEFLEASFLYPTCLLQLLAGSVLDVAC